MPILDGALFVVVVVGCGVTAAGAAFVRAAPAYAEDQLTAWGRRWAPLVVFGCGATAVALPVCYRIEEGVEWSASRLVALSALHFVGFALTAVLVAQPYASQKAD